MVVKGNPELGDGLQRMSREDRAVLDVMDIKGLNKLGRWGGAVDSSRVTSSTTSKMIFRKYFFYQGIQNTW